MNDTKILIEKIKEGIQEKKGKNIIIADLTSIEAVSYTHLDVYKRQHKNRANGPRKSM